MSRLLLTSAGLESRRLQAAFLYLAQARPETLRVLFVTAAVTDPGAVAVLPKCMADLLNAGVLPENITVNDLHRPPADDGIAAYDVIYVCGGHTGHLLGRVLEVGFDKVMRRFFTAGGVYVGVSAGSLVMAANLPGSLRLLDRRLLVHQQAGSAPGPVATLPPGDIPLTDRQAVLIEGDSCRVVG